MEAVVSDKAHLHTTSEIVNLKMLIEGKHRGRLRGGNAPNEMENYPSPVTVQQA